MKLAAFNQGATPTVALVNKAALPLGCALEALARALQSYLDECFVPAWGTPARITIASAVPDGCWGIVFLDDADAADALGYHDLTHAGLPLSKVFVRDCRTAGEAVSVTASHELAEMMIDPACNLWADAPDGTQWAYETADAVEGDTFQIDGIAMSDFVMPAFFEGFRAAHSVKFDHMGLVERPFSLRPGGYSLVRRAGRIDTVFGSSAKAVAFAEESRRMHRSQYRERGR